jgi:DNA gyrase subunit A
MDASIYGNAVRMSQDFSLRYPLIDTHGNNGSLMHNNDYAADRYLEMRSGEIADEMTNLLQKETIDKWKLNYTEEEEYPTYFPTTFPNSLVNGNFGIGVSLASSIPSHNLNEVSDALIKLLNNPEIDFDEIYCPIDFPTGGTIINSEEVKESHKRGTGKAAIIRADMVYDEDANELIATNLPYMVFSSNATVSIQNAIDEGKIYGIESVFDGTDLDGVKIVIKLSKNANVNRITKLLYKHTLLQGSYGINMNMLADGKYPKCFTWKEMMETYLEHLCNVLRKSYEFDLKKLKQRLHIVDGLIIAIQNIEEVVKIIKSSPSTSLAKIKLQENFNLSEEQSQAILNLKLSRLANLELQKLIDERAELNNNINDINIILTNENKFKKIVIDEILRIKNKYGDERKTKCINLDFTSEEEDAEPIEKKELLIHYTNLGNIYTQETTTLLTSKRGGSGKKIKLANNEAIIKTIRDDNFNSLLVFSNKGQMYHLSIDDLPINGRININQLFDFNGDERPTAITSFNKKDSKKYYVFLTKKGLIKKTEAKEYNIRRGKSIKAINLKEDDEVVKVLFLDNERMGILSNNGNYIIINSTEINAIGRVAAGVKAMNLATNDFIIDAHLVEETDKYLITLSKEGIIKKASLNDFPTCNRGIKGKRISDVKDNDKIIKCLAISTDCDIIIIVNKKCIKFSTSELRPLSRTAVGVKGIDLGEGDFAIDLIKE